MRLLQSFFLFALPTSDVYFTIEGHLTTIFQVLGSPSRECCKSWMAEFWTVSGW